MRKLTDLKRKKKNKGFCFWSAISDHKGGKKRTNYNLPAECWTQDRESEETDGSRLRVKNSGKRERPSKNSRITHPPDVHKILISFLKGGRYDKGQQPLWTVEMIIMLSSSYIELLKTDRTSHRNKRTNANPTIHTKLKIHKLTEKKLFFFTKWNCLSYINFYFRLSNYHLIPPPTLPILILKLKMCCKFYFMNSSCLKFW